MHSYKALDEIVWVKTNQLGRLIRTGRTGHWLNHSKGVYSRECLGSVPFLNDIRHSPFVTEHCIVAYKLPTDPNPEPDPSSASSTLECVDPALLWANRGIDTDVIVSEVRETSRKPDEIYSLIERICPPTFSKHESGNGEKEPARKRRLLELFGRKHNTREGWLTLGNQLGDSRIYEEEVVDRLNARQVHLRKLQEGPIS